MYLRKNYVNKYIKNYIKKYVFFTLILTSISLGTTYF